MSKHIPSESSSPSPAAFSRNRQLTITVTNHLRLTGLPAELESILTARLRITNPKWLENDRMGRWNRNVPKTLKFYTQTKSGEMIIPRGYARRLILLCREMEIPHQIIDRRRLLAEVQFPFSGRLKPFQQTAVDAVRKKDFGVLNAPTGSGKTVIALALAAYRKQPVSVVVHTKDLLHQWIERIESFLGVSRAEIGVIGGGRNRPGDRITVSLVQSLYSRAGATAEHTGFLIVDECHRTPSRTFTEAVSAFDSQYMLGLSATPWRRDRLSKLIYWHLGDLQHRVDRDALIDTGYLPKATVIVRKTDFVSYHDPVQHYTKMLSELTVSDERNHLIAGDIAVETRNGSGAALVLSDRKHHCETLRSLLKYKYGVDAALLTGDVPETRRREIAAELATGKIGVVVATGHLVGEGFDAAGLSSLFITTPIKFGGRLIQYLGRILRPAAGKARVVIYDYADVKVGPLEAAFEARLRVYREHRVEIADNQQNGDPK
jgi:superfamily II DNA or RNA helicase